MNAGGRVLVFVGGWALACGGGAPVAAPSVSPGAPSVSPAATPVPGAAFRFPQRDEDQLGYWSAKAPASLGPPVASGADGGWAWLVWVGDGRAVADAWVEALGEDALLWRDADTLAVDQGGARAVLELTAEGARVKVRLRSWFHAWPAELPTDPFCPTPLRPAFRYADGEVVVRACVTLNGDAEGPYEATFDDVTVHAQRRGDAFDGPFVASDASGPIAQGTYARGRPDGVWTHGAATVVWADGHPTPRAIDGAARPIAWRGDGDTRGFELLDWQGDRAAWRVRSTPEPGEEPPCRYPDLAPGEGVTLGLSDLTTGEARVWTVYAPGAGPCTSDADAAAALAEAKAAWAAGGLDPAKRPAVVPIGDGVTLAGHRVRVPVVESLPAARDAYGPWLLSGAPYEDSDDGHGFLSEVYVDEVRRWATYDWISSACAGSGAVVWVGAVAREDAVLLIPSVGTSSCDGSAVSYGFSPVLAWAP